MDKEVINNIKDAVKRRKSEFKVEMITRDTSYTDHGLSSYFFPTLTSQGSILDEKRKSYVRGAEIYYQKGLEDGMDVALYLPQIAGDSELGNLIREFLSELDVSFMYHSQATGLFMADSEHIDPTMLNVKFAVADFECETDLPTGKIEFLTFKEYRIWVLKKLIKHIKDLRNNFETHGK